MLWILLFSITIVASYGSYQQRKKMSFKIRQVISEENITDEELPRSTEQASTMWSEIFLTFLVVLVFAIAWFSPGASLLSAGLLTLYVSSRRNPGALPEDSIAQSLPLFIEQLVMAVQSGLDVPSAIASVLDIKGQDNDPCTEVFWDIRNGLDAGHTFEEVVQDVQEHMSESSLSYVCMYLLHAHREGGALTESLHELSASVQARYEDDQEEWIATLPVKATMPLLCIFLGLLLLFLTAPLLQLLTLLESAI